MKKYSKISLVYFLMAKYDSLLIVYRNSKSYFIQFYLDEIKAKNSNRKAKNHNSKFKTSFFVFIFKL